MSYRKITISNKLFEYFIGKAYTKIRHFGVFKNEEIGKTYRHGYRPCGCRECTCEPYEFYDRFEIRPNDMRKFIEAKFL